MKKKLISCICVVVIIIALNINFNSNSVADTYPEGDITSDTVWTKDQGPYMINQNVIVASNAKLTIEAGSEIIFLNSSTLAIKGILNVDGNENDPVIFKYHSSIGEDIEPHQCINIKNDIDDPTEIKYAKFYDFYSAISVESSGGQVLIHGSEFYNHYTSVSGSRSSNMRIENCVFDNNTYGVHGVEIEIHNSIFKNNEIGVYEVEDTYIYDSIFTGNNISIYGSSGIIKRCNITENNRGIQSYGDGFSIYSNHIVKNNIGIFLLGEETKVNYNNIYDNSEYNLRSQSHDDIDATNNWWGTIDSELIDQSIFTYEIYDGAIMGEIIYEPFLQSEITDFNDRDNDGIPDNLDEDTDNGKKSIPSFEIIFPIFILIIFIIIVLLAKRRKLK